MGAIRKEEESLLYVAEDSVYFSSEIGPPMQDKWYKGNGIKESSLDSGMNREQEKVGKNKTKPQVSLHREWQRDVEVPYEHLITVHSGQKYRVRFLPHQLKKVLTFGELFHLPQLY